MIISKPINRNTIENVDYLLSLVREYKGCILETTLNPQENALERVMTELKERVVNQTVDLLPYSVTYLTHQDNGQYPHRTEIFKICFGEIVFYIESTLCQVTYYSAVTITDNLSVSL